MPADRARLRSRARRITAALENHFGTPSLAPRTDLIGSFVLTLLSQSTTDVNSGRAYRSLRDQFPDWSAVATARPKQIADAIRSAGLANQKSVRIRDFVRWVKERFGAYDLSSIREMSNEAIFDLFTQVKGIGVKTVAVVLVFSLGRDVFPVDTHVHRICRRVGLVPDRSTAEQTHTRMAPLVPRDKALSLHVNLLRLGRAICHSQNPKCPECPLRRMCDYAKARRESRSR
jgi:endonuclease-3